MERLPDESGMIEDMRLLGLDTPHGFSRRIGLFLEHLAIRNRSVNLIGPAEAGRIWARHVLESAAFTLLLDRSFPVVDIGSGAGFPGIVLALLGFEVTLVEPRRNRALFLEYVLGKTGPASAVVARCRVEDREWEPSQFTARAVLPVPGLLALMEGGGARGTLTVRTPEPPAEPFCPDECIDLPSPPLDRPGVLVQYRIPIRRQAPEGCSRKANQ